MTVAPPHRENFLAVILATTAALFFRAWLQLEFVENGLRNDVASDLSYLVVPPTLLVLLFPLWRQNAKFILGLFRRNALTTKVILNAVAVGLFLRLAAWSELIAGVAFGWYTNPDPTATVGPVFDFNCGTPQAVALGIIVTVALVPFVEELIHRGLVQCWLFHRGAAVSIGISALLFMLGHRTTGWAFAFVAGLVFGIQFWQTRSLWCPLISHATVNALIQIDWRCLNVQWNPRISDLPVLNAGVPSIVTLLISVIAIIALLRKTPGRSTAPAERVTER